MLGSHFIVRQLPLVCAALLVMFVGVAHAQDMAAQFPIRAPDGSLVANHAISPEDERRVAALPGAVVVGNPQGDVTLTEFYDLNCPFCRKAAADMAGLLKSDKGLRVVLVPYPVLGIPSIQAGRVELALAKLASAKQFYDFHRKVYEGRGVIDGNRALAAAKALGFAPERIIAVANDEGITETMKAHARLGSVLGLDATPSFVVKGVAIVGYPGRAGLEKVVRAVRQCGKVVCG